MAKKKKNIQPQQMLSPEQFIKQKARNLPVEACYISKDIENVVPLSDFRNTSSFGEKYGVLMKDGPLQGLLARAVVVINPQGEVIYSELVPEITQEPNYEAILKVIPKA